MLILPPNGARRSPPNWARDVIFAQADVASEEAVQAAIKKTIDAFGAIHIVINCAGTGDAIKVLSKKGPYPLAAFNRIIQINLVGTFNVIRLAVEQMVKNEPNEEGEKGVIINTASAAAFDGQIGQASYSASKAGVCRNDPSCRTGVRRLRHSGHDHRPGDL